MDPARAPVDRKAASAHRSDSNCNVEVTVTVECGSDGAWVASGVGGGEGCTRRSPPYVRGAQGPTIEIERRCGVAFCAIVGPGLSWVCGGSRDPVSLLSISCTLMATGIPELHDIF